MAAFKGMLEKQAQPIEISREGDAKVRCKAIRSAGCAMPAKRMATLGEMHGSLHR